MIVGRIFIQAHYLLRTSRCASELSLSPEAKYKMSFPNFVSHLTSCRQSIHFPLLTKMKSANIADTAI